MLVVFPIGLWIFSFVCDLIFLFGNHHVIWTTIAQYSMGAGIVGAALAAIPGFIDWLSIRDARAKRIGLFHMLLNVTILLLFAINFWMRLGRAPGAIGPIILSLVAIMLLAVSGWLGGTLVYELGVAVEERSPTKADR